MTAPIIPFPSHAPFAFRVQHEQEAWLVLCRSHGWLHGDRLAAIADGHTIAQGFGAAVAVSS